MEVVIAVGQGRSPVIRLSIKSVGFEPFNQGRYLDGIKAHSLYIVELVGDALKSKL